MLALLRSLFSPAHAAPVGEWQPFALTEAQAARHAQWVAGRVYRNWLGPYFKAYHLHKGGAGGRRGLRAEPLQEQGRQGALFFYSEHIGTGNFRHLFEYVGARVQALGYYRACADECTRQNAQQEEHTLKQFFKPRPTDCPDSGHCNQRYGLVTLDLVMLNGEPLFLRLATNPVLEDCFTPAQPFEELLRTVFGEPAANADEQAQRQAYLRL